MFSALKALFLLALALFPLLSSAQERLKINLDESGKTYIKASFRMHTWLRYTEMNPGSEINGEATADFFDVSVRRLRMSVAAQLTPKLYVWGLFGGNNLSFRTNQNFNITVLDLSAEYAFHKAFEIGVGKSGWQGLSRWNIRSSKSMMGLDAPLFSLNTVSRIDDIGRNLGLYMKGQAGKWDYRLVLNTPNFYSSSKPTLNVEFAHNRPRIKTSGYLKYQFWEKESNKSGYHTGTYVGKKKVLNLGVGFMRQAKALWSASSSTASDTLYHDLRHWAADFFIDLPINTESHTAFTAYTGFYRTYFGPDYIRNVGANSPATGSVAGQSSFNGSGNAFPMMGTGQTVFVQLGYLLGSNLLGSKHGQLQPNLSVQFSDFEALADPMTVVDLGINWFFSGHNNKLSLNYQSRPIYELEGDRLVANSRKGMWVLQYAIELN